MTTTEETDKKCPDLVGDELGLPRLREDVARAKFWVQAGGSVLELVKLIGQFNMTVETTDVVRFAESEIDGAGHLLDDHLAGVEDLDNLTEREAQCLTAGVAMGISTVVESLLHAIANGLPDQETFAAALG